MTLFFPHTGPSPPLLFAGSPCNVPIIPCLDWIQISSPSFPILFSLFISNAQRLNVTRDVSSLWSMTLEMSARLSTLWERSAWSGLWPLHTAPKQWSDHMLYTWCNGTPAPHLCYKEGGRKNCQQSNAGHYSCPLSCPTSCAPAVHIQWQCVKFVRSPC